MELAEWEVVMSLVHLVAQLSWEAEKGYAKQGKVYGGRHFVWESRQESRNFCRLS